jgi:SAM-dependent methyltransferase
MTQAEAYDRHVGRYGPQLAAGLIAVAGVRPGQRTLDIGCGPGPLTVALAERLGPDNVAAVDPSEPFVHACRTRVPGADVRVAAAEQLPFADHSFDAVLAQLVVQLMADRDAGMREMVRVARPGATLAALVWDYNTMPLLRAFWDSLLDIAPELAGALDDGQRVGYDAPEALGELWTAHGLTDVATGERRVQAHYEDFDDLFGPFAAGVGHSGACYTALDPQRRRVVRDQAHRRLGCPSGPFTLSARAWWARGRAPRRG